MRRCSLRLRWLTGTVVIWVLFAGSGCAAKRQSGLTESVIEPPARTTTDTLKAQAEEAWNVREDPDSLLEAILLYKKVVRSDPSDRAALVRLSRALYFYADGYLTRDEERLSKYDQGTYYGEKALALNPRFKALIDQGEPILDALEVLGPEDCEAVYWTAANLGKWAKLKGLPTILRNTTLFKAMMEKADSLDDTYNYGGPSRTWGAYYAAAPSIVGGDLEKSLAYFERAREIAPQFFATRVLMAELYATKIGDREMFGELLESVVNGDPSSVPEMVPEQKVEQNKARRLLVRETQLFEK